MRLQSDGALHLGGTRDEGAPLARDAHVQIAGGIHEMEFARAALRDYLFEAVARLAFAQILHLHAPGVVHLRLEFADAADFHGAQRYAEVLAAAPHALHQLHEARAKYAFAYLVGQRLFQFVSFHAAIPFWFGCVLKTAPAHRAKKRL